MLLEILQFLKDFEGEVFTEHLKKIEELLSLIYKYDDLYETFEMSQDGDHLKACLKGSTGYPVQCDCQLFEKRREFVEDLINKYYLLSFNFIKK